MSNDPVRTVTTAFTELDEALKLDPGELDRAIKLHHEITQHLTDVGLIVGAFLQGSLARKTMIAPLRDVDKVVLLADPERSRKVGPKRVAEEIAEVLRVKYPAAEITIGKHSICLDFGESTFSFDVVPAIDLGDDVDIIDTRSDPGRAPWKTSNTRRLIRVVQERNQATGGRFVRQARMAKLYGRERLGGELPGLHFEAIAFRVVTSKMDHDQALAATLLEAAACLAPSATYMDPTGVDELSRRLDPGIRHKLHQRLVEDAARARTALDHSRRGEHNAAVAIWHELLGATFPRPDANAAIESLVRPGTGITETITRTAPTPPPRTRAWRQ